MFNECNLDKQKKLLTKFFNEVVKPIYQTKEQAIVFIKSLYSNKSEELSEYKSFRLSIISLIFPLFILFPIQSVF